VIRKATIRLKVEGQEIDLHYRVAGSGPVLLLLHPSPLSSEFMQPLMQRLAPRATVIAIDTPGFGLSSPIENPVGDLAIYAATISAVADALKLSEYAIYGSATGAQIAIETAKADKHRVAGIVLDNAAAFTDAQGELILAGYFPDMTPHADGRHLSAIWRVAHDGTRYFPWYKTEKQFEIAPDFAPAAAIQATAQGYLEAGPGYETAYRAAFANERAERLQAVDVPVVVMRWAGSILKRYSDQLDDFPWGKHVVMAHSEASVDARWASLDEHLDRVLPATGTDVGQIERQSGAGFYVDAPAGQVYIRRADGAPARLVLHDAGGCGALVAGRESGDVVMDLPGHGGSVGVEASLANCRSSADAVCEHFGMSRLQDIQLVALAPPDLTPRTDGTHLNEGWNWLRDHYSDERDMADHLTRRLAALLRAGPAHLKLYKEINGS